MNKLKAKNDFKAGLKVLLEDIGRALSPEAPDPYAGAGKQTVLEHTTRIYFLDRFLELLGWRLGLHGNVAEEARIKAGTTAFMDYLGVNETTRAPVLLVEAKAWDTPFIAPRSGARFGGSKRDLLLAAIQHVRNDGTKEQSPAIGTWHDSLKQVGGYVRDLKTQHGHDLPCAVLSSGSWIVVFKSPTTTFFEGTVDDKQFEIFKQGKYVEKADTLFDLLHRTTLASVVPFSLRPSQLRDYVTAETVSAVFCGLHVTYESSGTVLFARQPRVLLYPALIIQRDDDTLLTAIDGEKPIEMRMKDGGDTDEESLVPHLTEVAEKAEALLATCSKEIGKSLVLSALSDFPGFPEEEVRVGDGTLPSAPYDFPGFPNGIDNRNGRKKVVRRHEEVSDEWLLATGAVPHHLMKVPTVHPCRFHNWAACRDTGHQIGTAAVSTPCTRNPRSFFVDAQIYYCAHHTVQDRRHTRCYIAALDERTCCRACVYQELCWTPAERRQLPCGS